MLVSDDVPENLFPVPSKQSTSLLGALGSPLLFLFPELDGSADIFGGACDGGSNGLWEGERRIQTRAPKEKQC